MSKTDNKADRLSKRAKELRQALEAELQRQAELKAYLDKATKELDKAEAAWNANPSRIDK